MKKAVQFVREAYGELLKVTWLTRKNVILSTWAVAIIVILVAIYISIVDFGLNIFLKAMLGGR